MAVNKIDAFGKTLIDLTQDTVTADSLDEGVTAHDHAGNIVAGTFPKSQMQADIDALKTGKVDKKDGYDLSKNDFTTAYKGQLDTLPTDLNKKVDKVDKMGLSHNDFTDEYKAKVDNMGQAGKDFTDDINRLDFGQDETWKELNKVIFELKKSNVLKGPDLKHAFMDTIDSPDAVNLVSGFYDDLNRKVYI